MKKPKRGCKTNIDLKYKKPKNGPELTLVKSFMENGGNLFDGLKLRVKFFEEPQLGITIPDIVIALWDEDVFNYWQQERNCLEMRDIKILHHMFLCGESLSIDALRDSLGYSSREITNTIERLIKASLLIEESYRFKPKRLEKIFFVKVIISIEAKVKNWKKAFEQAWINDFFASESYVLLPHDRIKPQILEYSRKFDIGLIGHGDKRTRIFKKPIRKEIPASYSSWVFNENLGRELYYES